MTNHPPELDWPFFDPAHREFKTRLDAWCQQHLADTHPDDNRDAVDAVCWATAVGSSMPCRARLMARPRT
jgi:hypothetical protein